MRKKIIIQGGYIRYVHVFGSKKANLKDVASIESISEKDGAKMYYSIKLNDKKGDVCFSIPAEVLPKSEFRRFERVVKAYSPDIQVRLSKAPKYWYI